MTIVVAHYGKPTVLAAAPPPSAPPTGSVQQKAAEAPPAAETAPPAPAPAAEQAPPASDVNEEPEEETLTNALNQPLTTEGLIPGTELAASTSRIQTVLGSLPAASAATSLLVIGGFAAMFMWVSKHALAVRRAVIAGENFAIRHPLVDVGLIAIVALSYLLTRTAGLIQ